MNAPAPPPAPAVADPDAAPGGLRHAAHEGIVTIDEAQRIVMINPAALRIFGCSAEEALGSDLGRFIPAGVRDRHAAQVRAFAASGVAERTMIERGPVTGLRANGEEFPLAVTITRSQGSAAFGPGPLLTALLCDLSLEHELRERLEQVRRRYESVFELSPNAIWIASGERIVFANRACVALFAAPTRDSLIGRSMFSLIGRESREALQNAVAAVLRDAAAVAPVPERIQRFDGELRDVEIVLAALPDHGETTLQMVISDVTGLLREAREAQQTREELRELSARLVETREEERRRIARELHDELGQRLTALKLEIASLKPGSRTPAARISAMLEMLDDTVASVRRISADLRPLMLDDLGFNAAIEWLARDAARRNGVEVMVRLGEGDPELDDRVSIALYRMVQEALTNAARHAHATEIHIDVREQGGMLTLTVHDNGIGFAALGERKQGSFGLIGMRERALMLGGEMQTDNPPGGGARITVRLPLAAARERAAPPSAGATAE